MKKHDSLGDRMKQYESVESSRRLMQFLPVVARIDGRAFSKFTRGMQRPYDQRLTNCMVQTTAELVRHTGACIGYTQSDEITLIWADSADNSQVFFNGRVFKMVSQLAAQATLTFYNLILEHMPEYAKRLPTFDARVKNVPNRAEAVNCLLWREWDATKNSISMSASSYYKHTELENKNSSQKQDMLHEKGVNWNNYPSSFKRGTYLQSRNIVVPFTFDELEKLPEKHKARTCPNLLIERKKCIVLDMPIFSTVANREDVVFNGADPVIYS